MKGRVYLGIVDVEVVVDDIVDESWDGKVWFGQESEKVDQWVMSLVSDGQVCGKCWSKGWMGDEVGDVGICVVGS